MVCRLTVGCVIAACLSLSVHAQDRQCVSPVTATLDSWCQATCNHVPPDCPDSLCLCTSPGSVVEPVLQCRTQAPYSNVVPDAFCQTLCTASPSFCPEQYCSCFDTNNPPIVGPVFAHERSCCISDPRYVFVTNNTQVLRHQVGSPTADACFNFPGGSPSDIAVDSQDRIYIADPVQGKVYRGNTNCDPASLEEISAWPFSPIDRPTGLAIASGALFVSGTTRVWIILFDSTGEVFDIVATPLTILLASDITVDTDGSLIFVENEASIRRFDPTTGQVTTVLSIHQHNIPDIRGVTINECGLYFTATDSNQVWFCSDPTDGATCILYCQPSNTDAVSCLNLRDPTGISSGCCCNVWVTNPGNGNLVLYLNNGTNSGGGNPGSVEVSGLFHPYGVTVHVPQQIPGCIKNEVCDITPSNTPAPTRSPSASVSLSVTSSVSPSVLPSPTPTPSPSATASASSSPSASPSTSSSPSASSSPSRSASASHSPSASASASPSPSPSSSPSPSPSPSSSPSPSPSPSASASASSSPSGSQSPSSSPSVSESPSPTPTSSARVTGRLLPTVNMAASGGGGGSSVLTGTLSLDLVRCPVGAAPNPTDCPYTTGNVFRVPISMITMHEQIGDPPRSTMLSPFIAAVSRPTGGRPAQPVCMFHTVALINRNGVIEECGINDCILTGEGTVYGGACVDNPVALNPADSRIRARAGATLAASGSQVTPSNLPDLFFQSAEATLCNGEVIGEFSMSLMTTTVSVSTEVNIISHPRFDVVDRCNSSLTKAPRVCIDTSLAESALGSTFGDENNLVCISDSDYVLANGQSDTNFVEFDANLAALPGDIIDKLFNVSPKAATCPFNTNTDPNLANLCNASNDRLCFQSECL